MLVDILTNNWLIVPFVMGAWHQQALANKYLTWLVVYMCTTKLQQQLLLLTLPEMANNSTIAEQKKTDVHLFTHMQAALCRV